MGKFSEKLNFHKNVSAVFVCFRPHSNFEAAWGKRNYMYRTEHDHMYRRIIAVARFAALFHPGLGRRLPRDGLLGRTFIPPTISSQYSRQKRREREEGFEEEGGGGGGTRRTRTRTAMTPSHGDFATGRPCCISSRGGRGETNFRSK